MIPIPFLNFKILFILVILSYTIFLYGAALYEIYNEIYKTLGYLQKYKTDYIFSSCVFLSHCKNKMIGFEKVFVIAVKDTVAFIDSLVCCTFN